MRVLPLLLLMVLLAPLAQGQVGLPGSVTPSWDRAVLDVPQGAMGVALLTVRNDRLEPLTVNVTAWTNESHSVAFDVMGATVAPSQSARFRVSVYPSAALPLGNATLHVHVRAEGVNWAYDADPQLTVRIVAQAPPVGSPIASPRLFPTTTVTVDESVNVTTNVRHASNVNQTFRLLAFLPQGWSASMPATNVLPNATVPIPIRLTALATARNGTARLVLENTVNATWAAVLDVPLVAKPRAPNATAPPPTSTPPRSDPTPTPPTQDPPPETTSAAQNETQNATAPANDTSPASDNATAAPTNQTANANETAPPPAASASDNATAAPEETTPPPPQEETPPATAEVVEETETAPTNETPPAPRPPSKGLTLRVEPAVVRVAPGSVADARLVLESDVDASVRVRVALPAGLAGHVSTRAFAVHAGEPLEVPFLLQADAALANGTTLDARVYALDVGADPAEFRVVVELPAPPIELTSLSAPGSAGGVRLTGGLQLALVAGGVGAAALVLTRRKWVLGLAALYARIRPSAVLKHPVRQRIAALAEAQPGLTIRDAQRALDLANGAMSYHLRTLEKAGIVRVVPDGMLRRVYPAGHARVEAVPPLAERVLAIIAERGEATPGDVAAALGASRQSVHYHVQKMVRDGTLRARVHGRETYLKRAEPAPRQGSAAT